MYVVDRIRPSEERHEADRTADGSGDITSQQSDAYQDRIITVTCGTQADVTTILRTLQDSEWKFEVQNGTAPVEPGLNLYTGQITAKRYLPLGTRADGSITANASF